MGAGIRSTDPARRQPERALTRAQHKQPVGEHALLALERRAAGNAAVSALLAGRLRSPGAKARDRLDGSLREIRRDEPAVDVVEKGLLEAKAVGVSVDLEGVRPPPAALAVTMTGFGPGSVAPQEGGAAGKPVPPVDPLGKAAKRTPAVRSPPAKRASGGAAGKGAAGQAGGMAGPPRALGPDQLRQPPRRPTGRTTRAGCGVRKRANRVGGGGYAGRRPSTGRGEGQRGAGRGGRPDWPSWCAGARGQSKESGKAGEVKGEVQGLVTQGKDGQTKDIETATAAPPDESKAVPKPVTPMAPEPAAAVPVVSGGGAAPKPAPAEQTNLQAGKIEADRKMADAGVSEPQLQQVNPSSSRPSSTRRPRPSMRTRLPVSSGSRSSRSSSRTRWRPLRGATAAVAGMKGAAIAGLVAGKAKAKSADETKRAEVTTKFQGIYAAAEKDVKAILDGIDPKVEAEFGKGEAAARGEFERYIAAKMSAYKKDRYGRWLGGLRWAKDKLLGMPEKVNEFYAAGREIYLQGMDTVISRVADIVGGDLTRAKQRIAAGRQEITAYVQSLPGICRRSAARRRRRSGRSSRRSRARSPPSRRRRSTCWRATTSRPARAWTSASRPSRRRTKGLVDKAIGAIKAIKAIRQLAVMLRDVLARAASVVGDIVKNPVGFLASLFGLTWARICARIAKKVGGFVKIVE